ncbi:hypothetical protein JKL49_00890 [Phenylobacterium sp. 20VBR1]|uniref:Twin-arginine translocation pathway signal protein n=1 Tax=Phenylobacterium glaciei TaxID=2803784 RepID=A0A941HTU4_9CAUL|nr:hypothetical protein [Phenylobacterium glaciei]MBR7617929.1 hypothetical protein [Phenylobacterium glaciei]
MPTRRGILHWLAAAAPLTAAGCSATSATDPAAAWRAPGLGERDPRRFALAHAILAPNPHNRQPWLVDLVGADEIVFYADTARLLPFTDPPNRQITLGCGAFLELLSQAAAEAGHRAEIALWPEGEPQPTLDARPVARVRLVPDAAVARDPLFGQILNRHTNRAPFQMDAPPNPAELTAVIAAARSPGLAAGAVTEDRARARLIDLGWQAWEVETATPATHMESVRLMRIGAAEIAQHRDGIALDGPMIEGLKALGLISRESLADANSFASKSGADMWRDMLRATPAFFWLKGGDNSRTTQIAAGRAYVRAQLAATGQGLSMHPWSMSLQEFPQMAGLYAATQSALGATPLAPLQMLVRIGRAKPAGPAPRRGLAAHIRP